MRWKLTKENIQNLLVCEYGVKIITIIIIIHKFKKTPFSFMLCHFRICWPRVRGIRVRELGFGALVGHLLSSCSPSSVFRCVAYKHLRQEFIWQVFGFEDPAVCEHQKSWQPHHVNCRHPFLSFLPALCVCVCVWSSLSPSLSLCFGRRFFFSFLRPKFLKSDFQGHDVWEVVEACEFSHGSALSLSLSLLVCRCFFALIIMEFLSSLYLTHCLATELWDVWILVCMMILWWWSYLVCSGVQVERGSQETVRVGGGA